MDNTDNDGLEFDPAAYRRHRIASVQSRYAWASAGVAALPPHARMAWQRNFRREFDALLGGLDGWRRAPLAPVVTDTQACDGYRRETVAFTTRPDLRACGYFLVPDNCPPGRPALLCLPGHGSGADSLVGLAPDDYAADFALQCVRRGYPTFALEQISFGRRRDAAAQAEGPGASSCRFDSMAALMLGETIAGWRVWDAMRALDFLTMQPSVAPARLGVVGISGGGLTALFTAALDTRVAACVVSGYFNTFAASILSIDHCVDNYAPGLLQLCEMPDLAALVAPRALFVENGRADPIFPVAAFAQAVGQAQAIYEVLGTPERFGSAIFEGGHRFHGAEAFAFLETALPVRSAADQPNEDIDAIEKQP